jgi:DNA polymerase III subunit beta
MQFTILKDNLNKALILVGKALSLKPQLPILSHILFKTEKNNLIISATNLELGIIHTTSAKIEKEGEFAIPGKLLMEFVATLAGDKIEFIKEETTVTIKSGKTKASFATISSSDFPPFPEVAQTKKTLPLEKLKEALLRTIFAASTDETRPVLTGVRMQSVGGKVVLTATDGFRLSKEIVDTAEKKEDFEVIIPASSLYEVVKIANEVQVKEVDFAIIENKNQLAFLFPNTTLFSRVIDGEFPAVEKIIPTSFKTKVTVDTDLFTQSVKTASLFARGAANIIKIKISQDGLHLSANAPQVGSDEDFVEAKIEGEETEIAFNYRFLLDLLAHFSEKEIVFESSGSLSPGVFRLPKVSSSFLHLIMPVRVQG